MDRLETMRLGVVVERRDIDSPWQGCVWRPVAVIPGAPEVDPSAQVEPWKVVNRGTGWVQYHAATLSLELHRQDTEAYHYNLASRPPVIYVVLRQDEEAGEHEVEPFMVTASPAESQDFLDAGDDIVEAVPMPEVVIDWVQAFVDTHHVDQPHYKRKPKRLDPDTVGFGGGGPRRHREGRR